MGIRIDVEWYNRKKITSAANLKKSNQLVFVFLHFFFISFEMKGLNF